jgi:hypothetical protein
MATEISPLDEDRMLKEAISNTEAELFRGAVDLADPQESDGEADRSQEEMGDGLEGQVEKSDEDEPEQEGEEEADGDEPEAEGDEAERDDKGQFKAKEPEVAKEEQPKSRVPVAELLTERKARQAAEDALKTERESSKAALDAMNARLDNILLSQQRTQTPPPAEPAKSEKPDMFAEPEKYEQWLRNDIASGFTRQRVESSLSDAHETHGESFVKAYQELTGINIVNAADRSVAGLNRQDPIVQATINRIMQAPNPGRELMRWHTQQQTLREVGNDPAKYREGIETQAREKLMKDPEFRKQMLADLKAEASGANGGQPRNVVRIPKSLSDVAGGSSANRHDGQNLSDSDADVFADTWKTG